MARLSSSCVSPDNGNSSLLHYHLALLCIVKGGSIGSRVVARVLDLHQETWPPVVRFTCLVALPAIGVFPGELESCGIGQPYEATAFRRDASRASVLGCPVGLRYVCTK